MYSINIPLSAIEMYQAGCAGMMRRLDAIKKTRKGLFAPNAVWDTDIEAAGAEMVVAKWLGRYWHALANDPTVLEGDVGKYQVRHTRHENGCLVIYQKDKDDAVFVLVVGGYPNYMITGWLPGDRAKQKQYWRDNAQHPAYFVPQDALLDPTDLEMSVKCREL